MEFRDTSCCGVEELVELRRGFASGDLTRAVKDLFVNMGWRKRMGPCFILFTGASGSKYTTCEYTSALCALIKKKKLGKVVVSPLGLNGNSSNYLRAYLWHVDKPRLFAWIEKEEQKGNKP